MPRPTNYERQRLRVDPESASYKAGWESGYRLATVNVIDQSLTLVQDMPANLSPDEGTDYLVRALHAVKEQLLTRSNDATRTPLPP